MKRFWILYENYGMLFLIAIGAAVLSLASPHFFKFITIQNILAQAAFPAIAGAGMTLAITSGGFDLSVGSTLALTLCVVAATMPIVGIPLAMIIGLVVGAIVGTINGLIITKLRVPTFIATLAMMWIVRGAALIFTKGEHIVVTRREFLFWGGGFIGPIPTPVMVMIVVYILIYLLLYHTSLGRHICAVGTNEKAARISGLPVDRIKVIVFMIVSITAAMTGIMRLGQTLTGDPSVGAGFELSAISVVIIGGTSLKGGNGKLLGTLLASIFVGMIYYGLNIMNTPIFYQFLSLGLVLLFALFIDGLRIRYLERVGVY